jgi:hypothetical protein
MLIPVYLTMRTISCNHPCIGLPFVGFDFIFYSRVESQAVYLHDCLHELSHLSPPEALLLLSEIMDFSFSGLNKHCENIIAYGIV